RSQRVVLAGGALLAVGVVLTEVNLRPTVTSLSSVLDEVRSSLAASGVWASVLTTVPTLCFVGAGVAAPWLRRRLGMATAVGAALAVLAAGLLVRVLGGQAVLLAGTFVACIGIAIGNVLVPVVVKESFPKRLGLMTGVYTAALQGGGAIGSSLTPSLDSWLGGWRAALAAWFVLALLALLCWMLALRLPGKRERGAVAEPVVEGPRRSFARSALAWQIAVFFGTQSFVAYVVMGWLPAILMDAGLDRQDAGLLLGLAAVLAVPISLVVAPLAARQRRQSGWLAATTLCGAAGVLGLLLAPAAAPVLWSALLGIGLGVFSLALTLLSLRTEHPADTARLSAMAQGIGYVIASFGPLLVGLLHTATGSWSAPLIMVLGVMVVQLVLGWTSGRDRYV
ncbi:MAG: MFS transporter, partial [Sciscionella sp.]